MDEKDSLMLILGTKLPWASEANLPESFKTTLESMFAKSHLRLNPAKTKIVHSDAVHKWRRNKN